MRLPKGCDPMLRNALLGPVVSPPSPRASRNARNPITT